MALCLLQVGVAVLVRPAAVRMLARPGPSRVVGWVSANSIPLYLWHGVGFACAYALVRTTGVVDVPSATTPGWWLQRPLWVLVPVVTTRPLLALARRF